jgi:two-component system, response regulator YesN
MNVLLVDDEPFVLEQLELLIKPLCPLWNIYTAMDSSQALSLCKQVDFQLVFLDIELPGKSGLEIAEQLKSEYEQIKIIILTAHQSFVYAKKSIEIGVSDYLTKPIIQEELNKVIQKYADEIHYNQYSEIVMNALNIVHEQYSNKITLSSVAEQIHVNPAYLSRKFSTEVGLSFSDYLMNYRIEKAKIELLKYPDYSISKISELSGFGSLHYFSTLFRKKVGMTPKQYREVGN